MTDCACRPLRGCVVETREVEPVDDLLAVRRSVDPAVRWCAAATAIVGVGGRCGGFEPRSARASPASTRRSASVRRQWRRARRDGRDRRPGAACPAPASSRSARSRSIRARDAPSALSVPAVVVGRRGGRSWVTRIRSRRRRRGCRRPRRARAPYGPYWSATLGPGALDPERLPGRGPRRARRDRRGRGEQGRARARSRRLGARRASDLRRLVRALATGYPDCWTYRRRRASSARAPRPS